jgi:hypothetical protein
MQFLQQVVIKNGTTLGGPESYLPTNRTGFQGVTQVGNMPAINTTQNENGKAYTCHYANMK